MHFINYSLNSWFIESSTWSIRGCVCVYLCIRQILLPATLCIHVTQCTHIPATLCIHVTQCTHIKHSVLMTRQNKAWIWMYVCVCVCVCARVRAKLCNETVWIWNVKVFSVSTHVDFFHQKAISGVISRMFCFSFHVHK